MITGRPVLVDVHPPARLVEGEPIPTPVKVAVVVAQNTHPSEVLGTAYLCDRHGNRMAQGSLGGKTGQYGYARNVHVPLRLRSVVLLQFPQLSVSVPGKYYLEIEAYIVHNNVTQYLGYDITHSFNVYPRGAARSKQAPHELTN